MVEDEPEKENIRTDVEGGKKYKFLKVKRSTYLGTVFADKPNKHPR